MGDTSHVWKFLVTEQFFFPTNLKKKKSSWGSETQIIIIFWGEDFGVFGAPHAPTQGSRGVGKWYTSSYDHDLWPVKILERSRSKIIIRKPWRRKIKKIK